MRRSAGWVALGCLVVGSAGCDDAPDPGRDVGSYVALGDSYTAGTGSGATVDGLAAVCGQVNDNYPRLVAEAIPAELTDVSCAGARTRNATRPQTENGAAGWPPQLDAVTGDTRLVTVGLGYNDDGFFFETMVGCSTLAVEDPIGSPCRDRSERAGVDPAALPDRIGADLATVLGEVRRRAPGAEVLVVGYPQLVPAQGTCPELPLASGDYSYVRDRLARLDDAMRRAAENAKAGFVDVMTASDGHDICAGEDAWVNGAQTKPGLAAVFHPFAAEQQAVADLVVAAVGAR